VVIPVSMGLDKGVWFCISQGIRGWLSTMSGGAALTCSASWRVITNRP
jgi:hypothetical protein